MIRRSLTRDLELSALPSHKVRKAGVRAVVNSPPPTRWGCQVVDERPCTCAAARLPPVDEDCSSTDSADRAASGGRQQAPWVTLS